MAGATYVIALFVFNLLVPRIDRIEMDSE